jgi:hypothetical protein
MLAKMNSSDVEASIAQVQMPKTKTVDEIMAEDNSDDELKESSD